MCKRRAMNATIASLKLSISPLRHNPRLHFSNNFSNFPTAEKRNSTSSTKTKRPTTCCYSNSNMFTLLSQSETEEAEDDEEEEEEDGPTSSPAIMGNAPPVRRRRRRYRKQYPGEKNGISEEMRFIAMKLRNSGKPRKSKKGANSSESNKELESKSLGSGYDENGGSISDAEEEEEQDEETWQPSLEGFLKYLVDSKLVFSTIERIVDESSDVSYAYFRKTGLERSECLAKDLEWFSQEGNVIPAPSNPGVTYVQYLEELAEKTPPLFLCHFYNIYFSHIAGGQVIAKKVSEKLLEGRKLEFYSWEGQEEELLKGVRENLNMLGEHWSRDEKNRCLRESTKAFRFLGQIVRLIIL